MASPHRALRSKDSRSLRSTLTKSYQEISSDNDDDDSVEDSDENAGSSSEDVPLSRRSSVRSRTSTVKSGTRSRPYSRATVAPKPRQRSRAAALPQQPTTNGKRRRDSPAQSDTSEILYETRRNKKAAQSRSKSSYGVLGRRPRSNVSSTKKSAVTEFVIPLGKIPDWASLPYQILLQIFEFAGTPTYDRKTFQATEGSEWLLKSSMICKAFAEPALTVLYRRPALAPMARAHRLAELLSAEDQELMSFKYQSKVEGIHMEVSQTALYTLPGYGLLDLHRLIYNMPRLQELDLYHKKDLPPYRELEHPVKWAYPEPMFLALEKNVNGVPTRLKSWRWNGRFAKSIPFTKLIEYHRQPYFAGLEKIAISNFQYQKLKKGELDPNHEQKLAEALHALKDLNHLVLESSTLINSISMPLLPSVEHLEIVNCWDVTSDDLVAYLSSHGHQLRHLKLDHNISLNLSFLAQLGTLCPKLITLRIDLTYFSVHTTYSDHNPTYLVLLEDDEIPDWPSSLQSIELLQLQRWTISTAQRFFQSLLDSAKTLPNLRRLVIKGNLNIGWRDRASFRERWYEPFNRVFKRQSAPPNPNHWSIDVYTQHKQLHQATPKKDAILVDSKNGQIASPDPKRRKLIPRALQVQKLAASKCGRSLRERTQTTQYAEASTSEGEEQDSGTEQITRTRRMVYSEAEEDHDPASPSRRRKNALARELKILHGTAGYHGLSPTAHPNPSNTASTAIAITDSSSDADSIPLAARFRRSRGKQPATDSAGSDDDGGDDEDDHDDHTEKPLFIQGMCTVVEVKIDNLRPAETQFKESDFLDSEPEGDEDWVDGRNEVGESSGRYAW